MTLVEFLTARLDEDEAAAKLVDRRYYVCDDGHFEAPVETWTHGEAAMDRWADGTDRLPNHHNTWHLAYDPARVLADVDAKRQIVAEHDVYKVDDWWLSCSSCGDVPQVDFPCKTLRLLALPHANHPDYDEAWRP